MTTNEAAPITKVQPLVWPSSRTMWTSWLKKSPSPLDTPKSLGTWPIMMVKARPMMNPLSTGSEMKLAMNPSRNRPKRRAITPAVMAKVAVSAAKSPWPAVTTVPTAAAERAAVADIGPTTRCFELPKAA